MILPDFDTVVRDNHADGIRVYSLSFDLCVWEGSTDAFCGSAKLLLASVTVMTEYEDNKQV